MSSGSDQKDVVESIRDNYRQMEIGIVNQLYFHVPHDGTTGSYRETVWKELFETIIPRKFVIEQSVFIIDSNGKVSNEVDLAIFDETYTPYVFRYGKLKFIPIEAVAVTVECKSQSLNKENLKNWAKSIQQLKTSSKSFARVLSGIASGETEHGSAPMSQTATRPLRILCCLSDGLQNIERKEIFDVVIRAKQEENRLTIHWNSKQTTLYHWYVALNLVGQEENPSKIDPGGSEQYTLKDFAVHHQGEELALMTFNFQLNQVLMLINNPMLFPHRAYAELFDQNNRTEEGKDE